MINFKRAFFIFSALAFFFVFKSNEADAAVLQVPQQHPSISSAVSQASVGDTISVAPGTYYENIVIENKNLSIVSTSGAANTVIDGKGSGPCVYFRRNKFDGVTMSRISGFTIRNGTSVEGEGAGITLWNSDVVIENNTISGNNASVDAGGIMVYYYSGGIIRNNVIDSNTAARYGGGIFTVDHSSPIIFQNQISNNIATRPSGWVGGGGIAVDVYSSPQIIKNTIIANHGDHVGGGISLRISASSLIEGNTITQNTASYGGGIHAETEGGTPRIIGNSIYGNEANTSAKFPESGLGGGISIYNQTNAYVIGNDIHDNFATVGGGGIVNSESAVSTITGNLIYRNSVTTSGGNYTGGGIEVLQSSATINNNVIFSNEAMLGGGIGVEANGNVNIQNNTIVKNKIFGDPRLTGAGGGISVRTSVGAAATIIKNIITQNDDYQIIEETQGINVSDNLINDDGRGLYIRWSTAGINDVGVLNGSNNVNAENNISGNEGFVNSAGDNYDIDAASDAIGKISSPLLSGYDKNYRLRGLNYDMGAYEYDPNAIISSPVYRFWSDLNHKHFYTVEENERNNILNTYNSSEWKYEGVAYRAHKISQCLGSAVHRFWSNVNRGHFLTISEAEKDQIIANYTPDQWAYEGSSYCAGTFSDGKNTALYRFWSNQNGAHFFTADASEKESVEANYTDDEWKYEGVAYYVYPWL